jgi:hypothetical protein
VIERERSCAGDGDPFRGSGVVLPVGPAGATAHQKRDGRGRLAGIAIRARIDADQSPRTGGEPRLLPEFPNDRLLDGLAELDEPSGERPPAPKRWVPTPHEQHLGPADPDGIHRERGVPVSPCHAPLEGSPLLGVAALAATREVRARTLGHKD